MRGVNDALLGERQAAYRELVKGPMGINQVVPCLAIVHGAIHTSGMHRDSTQRQDVIGMPQPLREQDRDIAVKLDGNFRQDFHILAT